jgi:alanine dehydrogenase
MSKIKIGIIREEKVPMDWRVPLLPYQAKQLMEDYPNLEIYCQSSAIRCIKDEEYLKTGVPVVEDISHCDILLGVKEVPIPHLIPGKTYFFFSHTIKKQPYNRKLLQEILKRNIRLIDYETLTDQNNNRIIAFGRFAGIVGAYNGILTFGKKYDLFHLKRAKDLFDFENLKKELKKVILPPIKLLITGGGRVSKGAKEIMQELKIEEVTPEDYLNSSYSFPVFTQLRSQDYHYKKDGYAFDPEEFYKSPQLFGSDFVKYAKVTDILIAAAYWDINAPVLFKRENMLHPGFKIKVIADITCDIQGSIPATKQASTIDDPFYDYDPQTDQVKLPFQNPEHITVMAIDNLPGELSRDASESFGLQLMHGVMPAVLEGDPEGIIKKATITENGELTSRFSYLQDFVEGK